MQFDAANPAPRSKVYCPGELFERRAAGSNRAESRVPAFLPLLSEYRVAGGGDECAQNHAGAGGCKPSPRAPDPHKGLLECQRSRSGREKSILFIHVGQKGAPVEIAAEQLVNSFAVLRKDSLPGSEGKQLVRVTN